LLLKQLVVSTIALGRDNSSDIVPFRHILPLPELRHFVLTASLLLPAVPSLNDGAKQLLLAIAGSYAMNNVLLPQSHTLSSHQEVLLLTQVLLCICYLSFVRVIGNW